MEQQQQQGLMYEQVARKDHEGLSHLYALHVRNAIVSFLAMRHRWSQHGGAPPTTRANSGARFEETMDDFLHQQQRHAAAAAHQQQQQQQHGNMSSSNSMSNWLRSSKGQLQQQPQQQQQHVAVHDSSMDASYYTLLRELAQFLTEKEDADDDDDINNDDRPAKKRTKLEISSDAERLLRDAAARMSDSRPPATFVVYEDGSLEGGSQQQQQQQQQQQGDHSSSAADNLDQAMNHPQQQQQHHQGPPIFDGSVANATPPPLGGAGMAGASGGAGTILHLACALDEPLALAFLLSMGADARACHTAFRRFMIHEAACNGSIQCLTLLLELGRKYSADSQADSNNSSCDADAKLPPRVNRTTTLRHGSSTSNGSGGFELPFMPRRLDRADVMAPLHYYARQPMSAFTRTRSAPTEKTDMSSSSATSTSATTGSTTDFIAMLRLFRTLARRVKKGSLSEMDAARKVLDLASLAPVAKQSLSRTCTFGASQQQEQPLAPTRSSRYHHVNGSAHGNGNSDGHGNTPLHWAAFKNETECVRLLIQYGANPNARAHPSGWTPLHDAAYSNSKECVDLLICAGAHVDARANSGATPLCFAAQEDAAEAAQLLLERGANLSTRCAGGPTRSEDNTQQPHHPHSRFSGYTPLHYCAHYNAHRAARILLHSPSAIAATEIPDLNDRLPIHVAVARGSSDVLRELLHAGARVETRLPRLLDSSSSSSSQPTSSMDASNNSMATTTTTSTNSTSTRSERRRQPPAPEHPSTPRQQQGSGRSSPSAGSVTPVSSPILRSMIPSQPVTSSKPWNCLTQRSIDECRDLISQAEMHWSVERHALFTPADRAGVVEVLKVGKRLEQSTGVFIELWPTVLSFCGRGWFDPEDAAAVAGGNENAIMTAAAAALVNQDSTTEYAPRYSSSSMSSSNSDDGLSLPNF